MMGAQFVLFFPGYKYVGTRASQMVWLISASGELSPSIY